MTGPNNDGLGLCFRHDLPAVVLAPQNPQTALERELGITEHIPMCTLCATTYQIQRVLERP